MSFGIYVHIPYCLQKCHYCDFTTLSMDHSLKIPNYTKLLLEEIELYSPSMAPQQISSLYFGGGTPSVIPANDILAIYNKITSSGLQPTPSFEFSLEINPGTINKESLDLYLSMGVNRFSVGVQTFNDGLLKKLGREHSSLDTRKTLGLLSEHNVSYSADLLFGLPGQTLEGLEADLSELLYYKPYHVSAYCLTLPESHFLNLGRPLDEAQVKMFNIIFDRLFDAGIYKYEVSNFARPGHESKHNTIYWNDQPYWGLGLSSHSYLPGSGPWGTRFWNPKSVKQYVNQLASFRENQSRLHFLEHLPAAQKEELSLHEALTDYAHTSLRKLSGLNLIAARKKFGEPASTLLHSRLIKLKSMGLIEIKNSQFWLSREGQVLTNRVFFELTFTKDELEGDIEILV